VTTVATPIWYCKKRTKRNKAKRIKKLNIIETIVGSTIKKKRTCLESVEAYKINFDGQIKMGNNQGWNHEKKSH